MELHIFHKTGEIHFTNKYGLDDYDGDEGYYTDFTPEYEELVDALVAINADCYGFAKDEKTLKALRDFITDLNLEFNEDYLESWRDELTEYFSEEG